MLRDTDARRGGRESGHVPRDAGARDVVAREGGQGWRKDERGAVAREGVQGGRDGERGGGSVWGEHGRQKAAFPGVLQGVKLLNAGAGVLDVPAGTHRCVLILQNVLVDWFSESQLLHKIVNSLFTITNKISS